MIIAQDCRLTLALNHLVWCRTARASRHFCLSKTSGGSFTIPEVTSPTLMFSSQIIGDVWMIVIYILGSTHELKIIPTSETAHFMSYFSGLIIAICLGMFSALQFNNDFEGFSEHRQTRWTFLSPWRNNPFDSTPTHKSAYKVLSTLFFFFFLSSPSLLLLLSYSKCLKQVLKHVQRYKQFSELLIIPLQLDKWLH